MDTRKGRLTEEEKEQMRQKMAKYTIKKAEIIEKFKKENEFEEMKRTETHRHGLGRADTFNKEQLH